MNFCPQMNDLIVKGVIKHDSDNCYVMADGSQIPCIPNEPLVQSVHHLKPAQTNYITLATIESSEDYYNSDAEENYAYAFPAEHAPKRNKEARKEWFEGVSPPP